MIRLKLPHTVLIICLLFTVLASTSFAMQRVISTDGSATELLFALGLQNRLIAVDVSSQLPPDHVPLPNIGYHRNLSAEGLLSLRPDLVVGSSHMGPSPAVRALLTAGVSLLRLKSPLTPLQLQNNIHELAATFNKQEEATHLIAALHQDLAGIQSHDFSHLRAAFLLRMNTGLRLAGTETSGDAFIQLLGASNIASFVNYQNANMEALLAEAPDILLIADKGAHASVNELLNDTPILRTTKAAKHHRIYLIDSGSLIAGLSIRAIEQAKEIANRLSTNLLTQADIKR